MSLNSRARRTLTSAAVILAASTSALVSTVGVAAPASAEPAPGCAAAKDKVVDISRDIVEGDDYGADGHIWALDTYAERIRIWQVGSRQLCVRFDDAGTFRSFAGVSPNGTGTVSDGVTGTWTGTIEAYVTADFRPSAPTSGYLGTIDAGCDQSGSCAAEVPYPKTMYFRGVLRHVRYTALEATFDGGAHGTWVQTLDASTGDVTG